MRELDPFDPVHAGPYTLLGRLGAGAMGTVYLGRSAGGRTVAVKVVRPELAHDTTFRDRFAREVRAARQVSGAFTAPVVDADTEADVPWLATTFVPSLTLLEAVDSAGPLPEPTLRALTAGIAEALTAVHTAGLVHRDLKPANVLLALDGPHVIDFGTARAVDESTALTAAGRRAGTVSFLAPEQVRGERVTPAGDVFALGAIIAYAAGGKAPFGASGDAGTPGRILSAEPDLSAVPAGLRLMVAACLVKDPEGRPTPREVVAFVARDTSPRGGAWLPPALTAAVERAADVLAPDGPRAEPVAEPAAVRPGRRKLLLGLAGGAVVLAGGGTALGLALRRGETSRAAERAARLVDPKRSLDTKTVAKPLWTAPISEALLQITGSGDTVVAVGENGLYGHDRRTGRRTWGPLKNAAEAQSYDVSSNPVACADGTVYVLGKAGLGGTTARGLRAVDVATGRVLWTGAGPGVGFYLGTGIPGVLNDQVYAAGTFMPMSGTGAGVAADKVRSALVWAVDRKSGALLWTKSDPGNDPSLGAGTPRLMVPSSGNRVLWQTGDPNRTSRKLAALDTAARGKTLWEEPAPGGLSSSLVWSVTSSPNGYDAAHSYAGGHFLYLSDRLYAVEPATGQTAWQTEQRPLPFYTTVVSPDRKTIYAATREVLNSELLTSDFRATVVVSAFDAATGEVRWAGNLASASSRTTQMAMECADGTVYLWVAGRVWALDMSDGRARWTFDFVGGDSTSISVAPVAMWAGGGRLYGTTDNRLVAISAGDSAGA
ncbi:serine/threonine-protein kinase [Streptomyces prunicolor]|uniref:serine/threonine-protein kinase n=1 Tax=Streptomyces prunicolor TaxID=67348 RepID=UPI0033FF5C72